MFNQNKDLADAYLRYYRQGFASESLTWSENNPHLRAMQNARNREEFYKAREAAYNWEADQANYAQQLADQEALRNDERSYNDPLSDIQRQRAAGLNPDLQGGSGSGSSGTSGSYPTPPQLADTSVDMDSPGEALGRVMHGVTSVAQAASSFTSVLNAGVNFFESIATFDDRVSLKSSQADEAAALANIAQDRSDISSQTKSSQIAMQNAANLANSVESGYRTVQTLASGIPADAEITPEYLSQYALSMGVEDENILDLLGEYTSSPQYKKQIDDLIFQSNKARAQREAAPYKWLRRMADGQALLRMNSQETEIVVSNFKKSFADAFYTEDNASLSADTAQSQLEAQNNIAALNERKAQLDFEAFLQNLDYIGSQISEFQKIVDSSEQQEQTRDRKIFQNYLRNVITSLENVGSSQMENLWDIFSDAYHKIAYFEELTGDKNVKSDIAIGENTLSKHKLNYMNFIFSNYMDSPDVGKYLTSLFTGLIGFAAGGIKGAASGAEIGGSVAEVFEPASFPQYTGTVFDY